MSQEIAENDPNKNPLRVLPSQAWHAPVTKFIAVRAYLVHDQLNFCVAIADLVKNYGLTLEDGQVLLAKLAGPDFGMEHRSFWDLMADLHRLAYHAIGRRRRMRVREVMAKAYADGVQAQLSNPVSLADHWKEEKFVDR